MGGRSSNGCGSGGSGVFPAASARGVESAPASAAVAASTVTGSGVFPVASARGAAGAPASAVVAAASAAVTATTAAAAAAAIPPDWARETAAARGGVFPTPPVDWTTARYDPTPGDGHDTTATPNCRRLWLSTWRRQNLRAHLGVGGAQGVCRTYSDWDIRLAGVSV